MARKATVHDESAEEREVVLRVYEAGYHITPSVKEEDLDLEVGKLRAIIEKEGGVLIAEGAPALTKLAYPMYMHENGKNAEYDRAYFGWLKFEASTDAAKNLNTYLSSAKGFLRSIVFRTVREDTRAKIKVQPLRESAGWRGGSHVAKTPARPTEEAAVPVSDVDLDKALEEITE